MKKEVKSRLFESVCFLICVAFLFVAAYFLGFFKNYSLANIQRTYNDIVEELSDDAKNLFSSRGTRNTRTAKSSSYNEYRIQHIPVAVIRGTNSSGAWKNIFYSNKKIVFYTYDIDNINFHNRLKSFLKREKIEKKYSLMAYEINAFNSMRVGDTGPSKICDSLEECNAVRQKAADYSYMAEFLKLCGKTMCVIKPRTKQYVRLNNKNYANASLMLQKLIDW